MLNHLFDFTEHARKSRNLSVTSFCTYVCLFFFCFFLRTPHCGIKKNPEQNTLDPLKDGKVNLEMVRSGKVLLNEVSSTSNQTKRIE